MRWIHVSLDVPIQHAESLHQFWSAALGWGLGEPWRTLPEFRSLEPASGSPYAHVQQVTDDGPARVHFDVACDSIATDLDRFVELGATPVAAYEHWHVLRSPAGIDFCLVGSGGDAVPPPATWPDGHRSRLVQLSLDMAPDAVDGELAFWLAASGWAYQTSDSPQYGGKLISEQPAPVKLLFQRLADDHDGASPRVHIDLGSDDRAAETARLIELGATQLGEYDGWTRLADPSGMEFCVTDNQPD